MSGASPQGFGVVVGPFPGCLETPNGTPGMPSYYVPPTGEDENGCPQGGSIPSVDDFNGLFEAINCILTAGGQDPLPDECLCANPCMLYDKLVEILGVPGCPADADPGNTYTLTCDGNGASWQSGGGGSVTLCPNNRLPVGWQQTITGPPNGGLPPGVPGQQGDTFSGTAIGDDGIWIAVRDAFSFSDGVGDGDNFTSLNAIKIEC